MIKITNISGAHIPLDGGGNLGPNQSITVNSVPRSLLPVMNHLRIESAPRPTGKPAAPKAVVAQIPKSRPKTKEDEGGKA